MGRKALPTAKATIANTQSALAWPALHPPFLPLELEILIEDQVVLIHNFFSSKDCAVWCRFLSSLTLNTSPNVPRKGEALRSNDRLSVHDGDFARNLWEQTRLDDFLRSTDLFRSALGLNPNMRLYRYTKGQLFAPHYDDAVRDETGRTSRWTLLLYLSGAEDGVVGGETAFYLENSGKRSGSEPIVAQLRRGTMLLHRHGSECLLHEGRPVLAGQKLVLRSDIMF